MKPREPYATSGPVKGPKTDEPAGLGGQPLGTQLKVYFDRLTDGPVPERLLVLTEQLDAAFERGELRCAASRRR